MDKRDLDQLMYGTRKIADAKLPCMAPDHDPPTGYCYEPGATYEHVCSSCRRRVVFHGPPLVWC